MRKLRLEIEELAVESFETVVRQAGGRGTVHGNRVPPGDTFQCANTGSLCPPTDLCAETDGCPDTGWVECGYSYGGTCGASPPVSLDAGCGGAVQGAAFSPPYDCV
jgi:hypothetical protein